MNSPISKLARCAIYTRKSTDYNLDLAFNSLDAQREACDAYITSQAGEGWRLVGDGYDDGAFSGGSLERPALKRLLDDVRAHRIDIVLVYKVDRLTRSLADFAKLIELFDGHGVSFVSVTQSFNTHSSMGRLTLNVLLSFAQFERELIGERVRDKIAASKRKGIWVGGPIPLGYAAVDKKIVVVPAEAATVRTIFKRYEVLGSIRALADELDRHGLRSKLRRRSNGRTVGGGRFGVGALDALRRQWRLVFGRVPPAGLSKDLLGRMVAARLQERAFGGLDRDSLRFLQSLARHERPPRRQLKPGTVLVREYQGWRHIVTTVRDGFDWQGTTYPSLSAIARAITGTAWSGPRFFALQGAGDGTKFKRKSAAAADDGRRQRRAAHGRNGPGSSPALHIKPMHKSETKDSNHATVLERLS